MLQDPYVDILGHADDPSVPCDFDTIVREAGRQGKLLELNNNSTTAHRPGSLPFLKRYILCCKAYGQRVCVASDAHFDTMVGNVTPLMTLLDELEFPPQLIVNLRQGDLRGVPAGTGAPGRLRRMSRPGAPLEK